MSDIDRRDELLQEHLEGEIDAAELRRRLGEEAGSSELEMELRAYRAVWAAAGEEPETRLPEDFARRVARAAVGGARETGERDPLGVLVAAASVVSLVAAAVAAGLLLPMAGVDPGGVVVEAGRAVARAPASLLGAAGAATLILGADRIWTSRRGVVGRTP